MKISSFYICVPKITIIWCMLPEIWVQLTIFCHFGSIFALLPHYWPQKLKIEKMKIKSPGHIIIIFPISHVQSR